ncbi:hypothetical protein [Micromonospora echinofusca]|uniref:Transcriptional regulator n=1 Tax=Micromonospora echinofusca TaxID=47858 RepID=A0ABS3VL49_MICEH|nr:hypothetical protein [Micromonospora echinofusca]MBO4205245.1 hypothetical protein [Micromonospora echinofusca]
MARLTPERLAQTRIISAEAVLRNEIDLRQYPYRHLAVLAHRGLTGSGVTELMTAVDCLAHYFGWELVSVSTVNNAAGLYAFLRLPPPVPPSA